MPPMRASGCTSAQLRPSRATASAAAMPAGVAPYTTTLKEAAACMHGGSDASSAASAAASGADAAERRRIVKRCW